MKPDRTLICTACSEAIALYEPQGPFTDPATFMCGDCMEASGDVTTIDAGQPTDEAKAA